jgi:ribosomal protein L16 Arg81 hydroxylase
MTRPLVTIHNLESDEIIQREMNDSEFANYQKLEEINSAKQAEAEAKAQAKATAEGKLAALGLTTDDLRALGL